MTNTDDTDNVNNTSNTSNGEGSTETNNDDSSGLQPFC